MADPNNPDLDDGRTATGRGVWTTRPSPLAQPLLIATPPTTGPAVVAVEPTTRRAFVGKPRRAFGARRIVISTALALTAIFACIAALIIAYRWVAPPTTTLMLFQRFTGTKIERAWRPLDQISPHLARAVIMSEDAGFCGHRGVDFTELERIYERGLEGGSSGGGSTIAMQVTKNLFLWPSKSYVRKAIEIPMTLVSDRWWGKRRTLEIYLNIAEWGPGIFGAEAAARTYFNKSALDLTEPESALLAVALPNPLARNAADPAPRQRRMAAVIQGRMRTGANNVRCLRRPDQRLSTPAKS